MPGAARKQNSRLLPVVWDQRDKASGAIACACAGREFALWEPSRELLGQVRGWVIR